MNKILKYSKVIVFMGLTVMPMLARAITGPPVGPPTTNVPETITQVFSVVIGVLDYLFYALILATIFFVLMAAFDYLTSAGDPEKAKEANKQLFYAAVAIVVGILSYALPRIAASIIGVTL